MIFRVILDPSLIYHVCDTDSRTIEALGIVRVIVRVTTRGGPIFGKLWKVPW